MNNSQLRNKQAEDSYFRGLALWRKACKNPAYEERSLKFLWQQLEASWFKIGYIVGDREGK